MPKFFFCFFLGLRLAAAAAQQDALLQEAAAARQAGDYARAASAYEKLVAADPKDARLLSNLGVTLHLAGRHEKAVESCRKALALEPGLVAPNLFGGLSLVELGRAKEALPWLERAFKADQKGPLPALALARAELALRDYRQANDFYRAAVARDCGSAEGWFGLGITYRRLLDGVAARIGRSSPETGVRARRAEASRADLAALEKTVRARPADVGALERLAGAYESLALEALSKAVQLDPASERAHLLLAESFADRGNLVEALPEYETAIRLKPDAIAGHLGMATAYWRTGDVEHALPPLQQALKLAPADAEANGIMGDILVRQGRYEEARPYLMRALSANPNLLKIRYSLGKLLAAQGKDEAAVVELRKSLAADPDGSYYYALAQSLKRLGRDEESRATLEQFRVRRAKARP